MKDANRELAEEIAKRWLEECSDCNGDSERSKWSNGDDPMSACMILHRLIGDALDKAHAVGYREGRDDEFQAQENARRE